MSSEGAASSVVCCFGVGSFAISPAMLVEIVPASSASRKEGMSLPAAEKMPRPVIAILFRFIAFMDRSSLPETG